MADVFDTTARKRRRSPPVTPEMAADIMKLYFEDEMLQHEIAAKMGINQGRVSEVVTGKRFPTIKWQK